MFISRHQNAGQNHNLMVDNKSFTNGRGQIFGHDSK